MNKLLTTDDGKFPFYLDDLRWIDEGLREAFAGIINFFSDEKFILSGCEMTWNPVTVEWTCAEGFIAWEGEILYCPGGTAMQDESNTPVFDIEVTYDPDGLKLFGSGVSHNTYEIRRAKFYAENPASAGGKLVATIANRTIDLIISHINNDEEDWRYPDDAGEPQLQGDWESVDSGALSRVGFKKDQFGNVWLKGQAQGGSGTLFTLPSGYRPPRSMYFMSLHPTDSTVAKLTVSSAGVVGEISSESKLNLDGLVFKTV